MIKLFGTGCEMCRILEERLQETKIKYIKTDDLSELITEGYKTVPMVKADDGLYYNFAQSMMKIVKGEWS